MTFRFLRLFVSRLVLGLVLASCLLDLGSSRAGEDSAAVLVTLKGHVETVYAIAFSHDGKLAATGSFDKSVKLWDAATGKELRTFAGKAGHQNLVLGVAFNHDGTLLASGGQDNTAKVWDVPSATPIREYAHGAAVDAMAVSYDGKMVAGGGRDGKLRLWQADDGKLLQELSAHDGPIVAAAFNGSGQLVATCGQDRYVKWWTVADGKLAAWVLAHSSPVTGMLMHPNNTVFTIGEDGSLKHWPFPPPGSRGLAAPHGDAVTSLALSGDGNVLVSGSKDKHVRTWAFANGQQLRALPTSASVQAVACSGKGEVVAAGTADRRLVIWGGDAQPLVQPLAHAGSVTALNFHAANGQLLSGGSDGRIKLWSPSLIPSRALPHPDAVLSAVLSADGKTLLTGCADRAVRRWDVAKNAVERQFSNHAGPVTAVALAADGRLASGGADETIRFWNKDNGQQTDVLGGHVKSVTALAFSPNGQQLLSAGEDGAIKLWQLPLTAPRVMPHPEQVTCAVFSPDGTKVLTGSADKQARLWAVANPAQPERGFAGPTLALTAVAFSPNGAQVAAASADKSLTVWTAADAKEVARIADLPAVVQALAFTPDSAHLVCGLADHSVRVYDVAMKKETKNLAGHGGPVTGVAFSPKGDLFVTASADKTLQAWNADDDSSKAKLDHGAALTSLAISSDGARVASAGADKTVKIWTLDDSKHVGTIATPADIASVSFNHDASRLAVAGSDHRVRVYSAEGKLLESFVHDGPVTAVAFSPDGKAVLSASADKTARLNTTAIVWQAAHAAAVRHAIFSPRGDAIVSASDDKTVRLWNPANGQEIKSIVAHDAAVVGLAISGDGAKIVTAGADRKFRVWNPAAPDKPLVDMALPGAAQSVTISPNGTRAVVATDENGAHVQIVVDLATGLEALRFADHAGPVPTLQFAADNRTLVSASGDKTVRLVDVGYLQQWDAHPGGVASVAFHGNGTQALSGGADRTMKAWDFAPGKTPGTVLRTFGPLEAPVAGVAYSRDFARAAAAYGKKASVWNLSDGKDIVHLTFPAEAVSVAFSADNARLAVGCLDGSTRVHDITTGREVQTFTQGGPVRSVVYHGDGRSIASAGEDKAVLIHAVSVARVIPASAQPLRGMLLIPTQTHILTCGDDKTVKMWNIANGNAEREFKNATASVRSLAVSRNSVLLAAAAADKSIRLYEFGSTKEITVLQANEPARRVAFSPNNALLAAAVERGARSWNVAYQPGQPLPAGFGSEAQAFSHADLCLDLAFAPDDKAIHLYSAGQDRTVKRWAFASDTPRNYPHPNLVDVVSFHPQGTHLATGCHDGRLRLWDVHTNQATKTIDAHVQPAVAAIYCLAWTADGKQIVTGSLDGSLKLWDAAAGTLVREFKAYKPKEFEKGHRDAVFCCSLSPDGKFLASGSNDRTIKIWNVADGSVALELVNPNLKVPDGVLPPNPPHSHPGWVYGLRYTHDGRFLISAGNSPPSKAYLAVWNATDGKLLDGKTLDVGPIHSLALGPPDSRVVGIACGTTNLQATEAFGYLLKMPDVAK